MSTITLPGVLSGIDTSSLITQLVNVESQRLARYQTKQTSYETQKTALESVRSLVSALKSATGQLSDTSTLNTYNSSSSDTDILTASASSSATQGSHSVEVSQLATTETWIQDNSSYKYTTDYVGDGTFIYTYNHQTRSITTVAGETTLEDLVNLINNDTGNPGVTASLLNHGGTYRLMLSGQDAGEDYQISVDTTYTETWKAATSLTKDGKDAGLTTKISELAQFTENGGLLEGEKITISGKNHFGTTLADKELTVNSLTTVGQLIDAINEMYDGVATARFENGKIVLADNISGASSMEVSMSYNPGTGDTAFTLPTMAVSTEGGGTPNVLNLGTFTKTQSSQSSRIKVDGYPTTSSAEIQRLTLGSTATGGSFRLTYNGVITDPIAYDATTEQIQAALTAKGITGITVGGDDLTGGTAGYTTFTFEASAGDTNMLSIDSSLLTFSGSTSALFTESTKGNNGYIERSTNNITDALSGITISLKDVTEENKPVKITVSRNTSSVSSKVQSVVTAYNALMEELDNQTEYDADTKAMGVLSSDMAVSYIKTQSRNPFMGLATGFLESFDSFTTAEDIGITFDGEGQMEFDASVFNTAIGEDFTGVLNLLGANKISNNDTGVIEFYNASEKYTTAGNYDIAVDLNGSHEITDVRIKLSTETEWRHATWSGNLVSGITTFDDDGNPISPENSLQFTVDLTQSEGTYTSSISVKQGIMSKLDEYIEGILETDGRLDISGDILDDKITAIETKIEQENDRLTAYKARLVDKFARLEKTLALLSQQTASVSSLTSLYGSS
ncbi:MAG: flagellar filament capping protein FliD [Planctomycetaceae bacterium]|nr:flagellar filament capping protein FliD [Planctomycetaceae bacterium]